MQIIKSIRIHTPEVTAQIIKVGKSRQSKEVLAKAKAEGAWFRQIAKENLQIRKTKDKGGEVKFDLSFQQMFQMLLKRLLCSWSKFVFDVLSPAKSSTYSSSYYIVKLNSKSEKSANWKTIRNNWKCYLDTKANNEPLFKLLPKNCKQLTCFERSSFPKSAHMSVR